MSLDIPSKPFSKLMRNAACLAAAAALWNCDPRMAGSSVGTGNPTEIEVAFTDGTGSIPVTGSVDVYAATQIPVPGFSGGPLIRLNLDGQSHATLSADAFLALHDSLWPRSSVVGDSACLFNVVVSGDSQGAVLTGFRFLKKTGAFQLRAEDAGAPRDGKAALIAGKVAPLVEIRGRMDVEDLHPDKAHFLFIYGTGFYARGDSGLFVFPRMPSKEYESFLISFRIQDEPFSDGDSLDVYGLDAPLKSGMESALSRDGIKDMVPVPDSLKSN